MPKETPFRENYQAWHDRESRKFRDGIYILPPWFDMEFWSASELALTVPRPRMPVGHFTHVSTVDRNMIAYTASDEKGEKDIQTPMKPGRYLKKFFKCYDDETIAAMSAMYNDFIADALSTDTTQLNFARDQEKILWVYLNGPKSCMSHPELHYRHTGGFHPVRLYEGSDLAIAYILNRKGRVPARTVVWPEKKLYNRLYGDGENGVFQNKLKRLLENLGYKYSPFFIGARISRKVIDSPVTGKPVRICPYLDCAETVEEDAVNNVYTIIEPPKEDREGVFTARHGSGVIRPFGTHKKECANCGSTFCTAQPPNDARYCWLCVDNGVENQRRPAPNANLRMGIEAAPDRMPEDENYDTVVCELCNERVHADDVN